FDKQLNSFKINEIRVRGNLHVSTAKILEYLDLQKGKTYSTDTIYHACQNAWNSQVFSTIYPSLECYSPSEYILYIYVKEKDRKHLALNLGYSSEDKLVAGVVLSLNNYLLKNSKLLAEVKLGGMNELNVDYVKNFGEEWGAYYRLFPYVNEKTMYNYTNHYRTSSISSLKWGFTTGIGVFAKDIAIAELFLFSSQNKLYSDISETPSLQKNSVVSGFGVKAYHESLDDYIFPTSGSRLMTKFNFARNVEISDFIYNSFQGKGEVYIPLTKRLRVGMSIDYGSYFNADPVDILDSYIIGGSGGFMGYSRYEIGAPYYQINSWDIAYSLQKRWRLCAGMQGLSYSDSNVWALESDWEYCYYAGIGFVNPILPLKLKLAFNETGKMNSFLSIGYDFDLFSFSRN
ncbi:MAG: BamA/TamA family outer membrane protein, partial [Candidatus Cloacimonetes bacterium]|nr:BamA/TamA family outer membrane protein [Candidatus Cloacimonadota bacterium]